MAFTLQNGRCHFKHRLSVIANTLQEAHTQLSGNYTLHISSSTPQNIFLFSGHGKLSPYMGRQLYKKEEAFQHAFDECHTLLKPQMDLFQLFECKTIADPAILQPALFSLEYALAKLWLNKLVKPTALIGHSMGELVAACIAEVCTLEEALELVALRGRLFNTLEGMNIIVFTTAETLYPLLNKNLYISAFNSPENCLVTGTTAEVLMFQLELEKKNIDFRQIAIDHPTHCQLLETIARQLGALAATINWKPAKIPIISTVSGELKQHWVSTDWVEHMIQPVKFQQALSTLYEKFKPDLMLEVGPGRSLISLIKSHPETPSKTIVLSSLSSENEYENFLYSLGQIWSIGNDIKWPAIDQSRIPLPTYNFEKQYYWIKPQSPLSQSISLKKQAFEQWFYTPSWKRMPRKTLPKKIPAAKWLVFSNNLDFQKNCRQVFNEHQQELIWVQQGEYFQAIDPLFFELNPHSDDIKELFILLKKNQLWPDYIIFEWSNSKDKDLCFYTPLKLLQALGMHMERPLSIGFIVQNLFHVFGSEENNPYQSLVLGPAQVANDEYPNLSSACLDLETLEPNTIMAELLQMQPSTVAMRGNYRWLPSVEPITVPSESFTFKEGGQYLISGGLGGIGLSLAKYLLETYHAKVILTSRKEKSLPQELSAFKANITLIKADVTNFGEMDNLLKNCSSLDGIIHAAGLAGMGLIQNKDFHEAEKVLAVKVEGTQNLSQLAENYQIPWVLCCSALNSFLGGVGQVDYVSANAFIDNWCQGHQHCISLNWGTWQEVGMAVNTPWPTSLPPALLEWRQKLLKQGITPTEGSLALERALSSNLSQIIVSPLPLKQLKHRYQQLTLGKGFDQLQQEVDIEQRSKVNRPSLAVPYTPPRSPLEYTLTQIWQEHLGFEPIGIHDNFFELGGHSLLAISMKDKLEKTLQQTLPIGLLFQGETIATLAQAIEAQGNAPSSFIVPLRSGKEPAIFCIHAISGTIYPFQNMANHYLGKQSIQAIQSPLLTQRDIQLNSVEEIANYYIQSLPEPPKILVGWSFGGLIAYEMAQQLSQKPLLVLLDIAAPLPNRDKPIVKEHLLKERFLADYHHILNHDQSLVFDEPDIEALFKIFKIHVDAANQYNGKKYKGSIVLIKAQNSLFNEHSDTMSLGWNQLVQSFKVNTISGDHYSMLNNNQLALYLQKVIHSHV